MVSFEVWAPLVDSLVLVEETGHEHVLKKDERGRWTSETPIAPSTPYRLRVDGKGTYPDPWSHHQPQGVHGPSMRWDHAKTPPLTERPLRPLEEAVIYELHIGTFSKEGTFLGAISHLDHLRDLGVTHVELMPVAAFPGKHGWGYDGVYLFAPHAAYGTPDDLKQLVAEAHARGLLVLLDVVFNHLGPDGNYLGLYAPYSTDRYKTPWGEAVNLDGRDSDLVRKMFVDCARHWLEDYGFDGLRLDAVHALYDQSATHFLEELTQHVAALGDHLGRKLVLIAECDLNDPRYVRPPSEGGFGLDAHWCDDFHHALHGYFTREIDGYYEDYGSLALVAKALRQGYVFDGTWSSHRKRFHGRPPVGVRAGQLVVCAQNHDQVGNRAQGERLSTLIGRAQLFQVAALTLLSPFVPLIFQGEEWGTRRPFLYFTDHQDAELGKNVTEGRRREFAHFRAHGEAPDPQDVTTFQRSVLDFDELEEPAHREIFNWYRELIVLRRRLDFERGVEVQFDEDERWLSYQCGDVVLLCNFGDAPITMPNRIPNGRLLLSHPHAGTSPQPLPPHSTVIYALE